MIADLFRFLVRIWVFIFFGALFLVLLVVGSLGMLALTAWSLITGKRLGAHTHFSNILRVSKDFRGGSWPQSGVSPHGDAANVVDVQAHVVRGTLEDHR